MADLLQTPAAAGILPPSPNQGLQTIAGILGIRQAQQNLQTGQFTQQKEQAEAQQQQQAMQERQLLQQTMKSGIRPDTGQSIYNDKNEVDPDQLTDFANRNLSMIGQGVIQNITKTQSDKTALNSAVADLGDKYNNDLSGRIRSFVSKPKTQAADVKSSLQDYARQNPAAASAVLSANNLLDNLDSAAGMKQKNDMLLHLAKQFQTASTTEAEQRRGAGVYQGKNGVQAYQNNPDAAGGIQNIGAPLGPQGVAPGVVTGPNSTLHTVGAGFEYPGTDTGKTAPPPPNTPRTAAQDAPPWNASKQEQDAYGAAVQQANGHVETVRTADENYGNNKAIASAVRQLASNADTGPGTQTWNHVMGVLGTEKANNYQELGAFLDRQAATVRGQMGLPGTNAGAEDAKMIAGNTNYNAKVIKDKNDYTEALTEGLHQYRNGLDRIAGFSGQASPQAVNQFKSAWTQNFDPNVYRGELAFKRSPAEGNAFMASLSSKEAASLAAKRKALQALSNGQLP